MDDFQNDNKITTRMDSYQLGNDIDWQDDKLDFDDGWSMGLEKVMQAAYEYYKGKWGALETGQDRGTDLGELRDKISKNLDKYDADRGKKTTYIYNIVENKLKDMIQRFQTKMNYAGIEKKAGKEWLTAREVASKLKLQLSTVDSWIKKNKLHPNMIAGELRFKGDEFEEVAKDYAALNSEKVTYQKEPLRVKNRAGEEYNKLEEVDASGSRTRTQVHNHGVADFFNSWYTITDIIDFKILLQRMEESNDFTLTKENNELLDLLDHRGWWLIKTKKCDDFPGYEFKPKYSEIGRELSNVASTSRKGKQLWNDLISKIRHFNSLICENKNINSYNINEEEEKENNVFS